VIAFRKPISAKPKSAAPKYQAAPLSPPHPRTLLIRTPAKLNLFLELRGKRPDGYHEIETVMIPVSRFDSLAVRHTPDLPGVRLRTRWRPSVDHWTRTLGEAARSLLDIPDDSSNLIHRAVAATQHALRIEGGFDIVAGKRIPAGAGMGGASSDAAAAIRAVVTLARLQPPQQQLADIAAGIGSDVPFFLTPDPLAKSATGPTVTIATGRGELLRIVSIPRRLWFVVAFPRGGLSTAQVYAAAKVPDEPEPSANFLAALTTPASGALDFPMLNRLSQPAKSLSPAVAELLNRMESEGLQPAMLTGSGAACFHVCRDRGEAERLGRRLRDSWSRSAAAGLVMVLSSVSNRPRWRFCR